MDTDTKRGFFVGGTLCSAWMLLPGNGKLYLFVLKGGEQDANVRDFMIKNTPTNF